VKKFLVLCCFLPLFASAQRNELGLSFGATWTSGQSGTTSVQFPCTVTQPQCDVISSTVKTSTAFTFAGTYGFRLLPVGVADLFLDFPVVATPGHDIGVSSTSSFVGTITGTDSSSLLFFTPSARLKFLPSAAISPWATVGGGLARINFANQNHATGCLQFGAGLDFKTPVPHLLVRAEARDFWSQGILREQSISVIVSSSTVSPERQHHVFAGAGVVVKF
jgi:hypothetical protein